MASVAEITTFPADLKPTLEVGKDAGRDPEKSSGTDQSDKASVIAGDVQDGMPRPQWNLESTGAFTSDFPTVPPREEYTEEQYKALKKKIDRYLLPLMWLCYGIQQTDKTSIGTQATFGLREVQYLPADQGTGNEAADRFIFFSHRIPVFLGSNVRHTLPSPCRVDEN